MAPITRRAALAAAAAIPALSLLPPAEAQTAPSFTPPPGEKPLFGASLWQLPNGLTVVHAENRRAPVVAHYAFYGVGAGDDPAGKSGLAHFLEHMMFKGSARVPSGAFSRRVAQEGGQDNAFTSRDVTAYHQHVEASRLPLVAMMEADRMAAPLFPQDELEAERLVVLEERRQRVESTPRGRFREAYDATFWGRQHWRGRPLIGWPDEIASFSRDDLTAFFGRGYSPGNTTLVVTGAVSRDELARVVEQEYGGVAARGAAFPAPDRGRAPAPATPLEPRLVQHDAQVQEAAFLRGWVAPSLLSTGAPPLDPRFAYPLEVLGHLLGGGQGSRLHKALVQTGIAVSASAGYDGDSLGIGNFEIQISPARSTTPRQLETALEAVLSNLLDQGVTEEEVARSIRQISAGALLALDSLGAAPRILGGALAVGLPLDAVEYWPARIRAVTRDQVTAAARAVLGRPGMTGWLLPEGVGGA
ncbi:M16 family metallopeptidase [Roseomonas marmotae]|uniref:Insulinase family protein n=1 Tax=Roseomonas marmotae TaxID=2768161 RepID=A0ABS3K7L0_9PROT|nr:pitrilysin family protein [Roseomonas marmotae]MBO1073447.1 insulinase family protein [Roseomonas marmotae]QTI80357.1 insulinase family protein [Roseomonas marmotae]